MGREINDERKALSAQGSGSTTALYLCQVYKCTILKEAEAEKRGERPKKIGSDKAGNWKQR